MQTSCIRKPTLIWIIQVLLNEGGLLIDLEDNDKATALHAAALAGQTEVIRKLVWKLFFTEVLKTNLIW